MGSISCPVCRHPAGDVLAVCSACETPHHPECWEFAGGCAVFACGEERAQLASRADLLARIARAEPFWLDAEREPLELEDLQEAPVRIELRHRESDSVMLVSWVYLAASLVLAIPTLGFVVRGLTALAPLQLVRAAGCGAVALGLKHMGDLLAIGDRRGRAAHLYLCLGLALLSVSLAATLTLGLAAAPFWTLRGRQHFVRCPR